MTRWKYRVRKGLYKYTIYRRRRGLLGLFIGWEETGIEVDYTNGNNPVHAAREIVSKMADLARADEVTEVDGQKAVRRAIRR